MVTQIYTAPLKATYASGALGIHGAGPVRKKKEVPVEAEGDGQKQKQQAAEGFTSVSEQTHKGVISIEAVVNDFQNTMDALGVTDEVREEVAPYLQVVSHQAQRSQPSTALIKQNLKAAGDTLDHFITSALGQPSSVVREWVEALLMQPIEFKSTNPIVIRAHQAGAQAEAGQNFMAFPKSDGDNPFNPTAKATPQGQAPQTATTLSGSQVKALLAQAKAAAQAKKTDEAMALYQQILDGVGPNSSPNLQGRVYFQMGRLMGRAKKPDDARNYLEQALARLDDTQDADLKSRVYQTLGNVLYRQGQTQEAMRQWRNALQVGGEANQGPLLNRLGILHYRNNLLPEARELLEEALQKVQVHNPKLTADVMSNLGAVERRQGNPKAALNWYKASMKAAQAMQDRLGMRQSLESIAALYLDAGKADKAFKALQTALYKV